MENRELLYSLNDETRTYLNDVFSYIDYFIKDDTISNDKKEDFISYSFLLATLKNPSVFDDIFKEYDISYDKVAPLLIDEEVPFKNAEDTEFLKNNTIREFLRRVYARLRYNNYLENTNILLSELQPYQIFDYATENYFYGMDEVLKHFNIDFVDEVLPRLSKRIYDYDCDFASRYGVDVEKENENEENNFTTFDFDYCKILLDEENAYIVFKEGFSFDKGIVSGMFNSRITDNSEFIQLIDTNKRYTIKKVSGFSRFDKSTFEKIFDSKNMIDQITINFEDLTSKDDYKVTFNSKIAFSDIFEANKQVVDDILRLSALEDEKDKVEVASPTPYLDKYGFDLTKDKFLKDPSVGREDKIREMEKILLYPEKDKSLIITGVAGCGKTALVKGLAYRIQKGDVPEALKNLRIISIDCATLVAGTKYVGTLEEKMKGILEEASSSKDIVLFMDEIHQALGAGKSEGNDNSVSEILKPYLDYGRVRIIGSTTNGEYEEYVSQDAAFKTRFKKVTLQEPTRDIIYDILDDLINSYNKFSYSKLLVTDSERDMIINTLLNATQERYRDYNDRASNPRLVLDILKDAYAIAALDNRTEVSIADISQALMEEERLYKSSREMYSRAFKHMVPKEPKNNIIEFRLIKK